MVSIVRPANEVCRKVSKGELVVRMPTCRNPIRSPMMRRKLTERQRVRNPVMDIGNQAQKSRATFRIVHREMMQVMGAYKSSRSQTVQTLGRSRRVTGWLLTQTFVEEQAGESPCMERVARPEEAYLLSPDVTLYQLIALRRADDSRCSLRLTA